MALHDTSSRNGGGLYPYLIGTPPFSSNGAQSYPSVDGLLCGFSFLSYLERVRSGGPEPLLQLVVVYHARLLLYHAAIQEDHKVGYALNIESRRKLSIVFRVDF